LLWWTSAQITCLRVCRCVGWAQCSKCPRPDGESLVPPGADRARCGPYPVKSCPVAGAHCPTPLTCCRNGELSHDCREFLPAKCPPMPAVNCAANVPASGWSVLCWKPSPAAFRTDPKSQLQTDTCGESKPSKSALQQCQRPCEARCLEVCPKPLTLRYVPPGPPMPPFEAPPCNPAPDIPRNTTCAGIGGRKLCSRVDFKYNFAGSD